MDEDTRELLNKWACNNYLNVSNELLERVKGLFKEKRTVVRLFLIALIWRKFPETLQKLIRPCHLSCVSLRSYTKHWSDIKIMVDNWPEINKNYTKIKIETILRIIGNKDLNNSDVLLFLEISKQNSLFRIGNKSRERTDNYSVWTVFTKEIFEQLNRSITENQIRVSIKSLTENKFIKTEKVILSKSNKVLPYPYWRLMTVDIKELSSIRKEEKINSNISLNEKFKYLFSKYEEDWSESKIEELIIFFKETTDRKGRSWKNPLKAMEVDLKTEERLLSKSFFQWCSDKGYAERIKANIEIQQNSEWVNKDGFENLKQLAKRIGCE